MLTERIKDMTEDCVIQHKHDYRHADRLTYRLWEMKRTQLTERPVFLLYQRVVLSVIAYGLGLTTMAQTNLLKLDRVQSKAMPVILGTTKDLSLIHI